VPARPFSRIFRPEGTKERGRGKAAMKNVVLLEKSGGEEESKVEEEGLRGYSERGWPFRR